MNGDSDKVNNLFMLVKESLDCESPKAIIILSKKTGYLESYRIEVKIHFLKGQKITVFEHLLKSVLFKCTRPSSTQLVGILELQANQYFGEQEANDIISSLENILIENNATVKKVSHIG